MVSSIKNRKIFRSLLRWVDSNHQISDQENERALEVDWFRITPFFFLHVACLGVIWVGFSWIAAGAALALYLVRMFAITGAYHRYFSHRTYKTSRFFQFILAFVGCSAVQRGPLWWASHHRHHHKHSDDAEDPHSPHKRGFWWSHLGWFTTLKHFPTKMELVTDWARFPELRFLNRFSIVAPAFLLITLYMAGEAAAALWPALGTSGLQLVVWGFFISTVALFHATASINSLSHLVGRKRFNTQDESRNNWFLALITLGEGWHNNHHYYPISTRQGFYWWELDLTYLGLKILSWIGLVRDLRPVPKRIYAEVGRSP